MAMTRQDENKKARLSAFRYIIPFFKPYRLRLLLTFCVLVIAAAAMLSLPMAIKGIIDLGLSEQNLAQIKQYFLLLLLLVVGLAVFASARFYLVIWMSERIVADLRSAVFTHVLKMDPRFFEVTRTGEVISRITTDTTLLQSVIGAGFSIALRSSFLLAGSLLMLVQTSRELTLLILLLITLAVLPLVFFGRKVRRLSRETQDRVADLSAMAEESLNAMQMIQAFVLETLHKRRFSHAVEQTFTAARQRILARALLSAFAIIIVFSAIMLVLWVGVQKVIVGAMSIGELSQFLLYAVIMASSCAALSEVWGDVQRAAGAIERLMALLQAKAEIFSPKNCQALPPNARREIVFERVSFYYPSRPQTPALKNFSLRIQAGETLALVGPSGAGKSTVFQLLLRFYDPQQGRIIVQDVNIANASLQALRQQIGIVPQDTVIFSANALENIRFGRPQASDREVIAAARLAVADEFIERLPEGYQSFLGERGIRLSGGQRQRIAIARAILKNPPILLLDEATSALDAANEKLVQAALEHLLRERTTLVIAHRLSTVQKAQRIIVMNHGEIDAQGTHPELLQQQGLYARLAAFQFSEFAM